MPTYWDEFYREFMHRLQGAVPEIVMLEAFWHYCNKGRDKCIAILNNYAAKASGAQPPHADNTGMDAIALCKDMMFAIKADACCKENVTVFKKRLRAVLAQQHHA